jgi:hypothetical protein
MFRLQLSNGVSEFLLTQRYAVSIGALSGSVLGATSLQRVSDVS